jgi:sugar lactone lactonase YvrE
MNPIRNVFLATILLGGCGGSAAPQSSALPAHGMMPSGLPFSAAFPPGKNTSADYVFVTNDLGGTTSEIEYFPVGSSGNVAPAGVITGSNTGLTYYTEGIAVNVSGEIFVASMDTNRILGFAAGASGNVSPVVTIGGTNTGLAKPIGLALDATGNLYVANCSTQTFGCPNGANGNPSIEEFAAGSNGNVAPVRIITGKRTGFVAPNSLAIASNGDIYVVDSGNAKHAPSAIDVFGSSARGDVAPRRVIYGPHTKLNQAYGLAVNANGIYTDTWNGQYVQRFRLTANGDAAPAATIKGKATQLQCCLDGMAAAPDGTVYVVDRGGPISVQQFAGLARGNAAPLESISGSSTGFDVPVHVFVGSGP